MKCEICQSREATVRFKQVINGEARELYVCGDCAAKNGFDVQSPMALTDFLFGLGAPEEEPAASDEKRCPSCGLTYGRFRKTSLLGCPRCYETFSEELEQPLYAIHGADRHCGKMPAGEQLSSEIVAVQRAMERAVSAEDFEEAAKLRDMLRDLKTRHDASRPGQART